MKLERKRTTDSRFCIRREIPKTRDPKDEPPRPPPTNMTRFCGTGLLIRRAKLRRQFPNCHQRQTSPAHPLRTRVRNKAVPGSRPLRRMSELRRPTFRARPDPAFASKAPKIDFLMFLLHLTLLTLRGNLLAAGHRGQFGVNLVEILRFEIFEKKLRIS